MSEDKTAVPHTARTESEGFPWLLALAALFALGSLLALGTWQVQRLHWKNGLIDAIETRIASEPRPIEEIETLFYETGDVDYWPATATGTFRHEGERHFLATWQGRSGFFVYTPLELAGGRILFVNRGFVPFDRKEPATRPQGQLGGEQTVAGLARNPLPEKPSSLLPDNQLEENVFYWKDIDAMAESAGLPPQAEVLPFFVDTGDAENPGGLPVGGVTLINLPNSHLQYAVTWYGLAAALIGVLVFALKRRWGSARKSTDG